jgi:hypothetical protein
MTVFISYARDDGELVDRLRRDLEEVRGSVWIDRRLAGGQDWWDEILFQIRSCELFVLALSPTSVRSEACLAETTYALGVHRAVLPIVVAPVSTDLLPADLTRTHVLDYAPRTPDSVLQLAKALVLLPPSQPLPSPLPAPPAVPESYTGPFLRQITASTLPIDEQLRLVAVLKYDTDLPTRRRDALELLRQLRDRPDIAHRAYAEIDEFLAGAVTQGGDARSSGSVTTQPSASSRSAAVASATLSTPPTRVDFVVDIDGSPCRVSCEMKHWSMDLVVEGQLAARRRVYDVTEDGLCWSRFAAHVERGGTAFDLQLLLGYKTKLTIDHVKAWRLSVDGSVVAEEGPRAPASLT